MSREVKLNLSCGLPAKFNARLALDQLGLPSGNVVEVIGADVTVSKNKDPLHHVAIVISGRAFRDPRAVFVTRNGSDHATKRVGNLLLRHASGPAPIAELQNVPLPKRFPKWLSHSLALWQYANMETCQIGYLRCVANDTNAPNRIRELREAKGLTQKGLAELANVTPSALNKLEMGTRGLDQDWMRRLAPLLGVSPADLLPDEDNPQRLSDEERALVDRYRRANERDKAILNGVSEVVVPIGAKRNAAA